MWKGNKLTNIVRASAVYSWLCSVCCW